MKTRSLALPLMLALLALPGALRATTTISGNLKDLGTNASSGFVRFTLRGCSGNQPTVPNVAVLAPTQGAYWFKDFVADATGHISGTIYSTRDNAGTGNGEIQCGTSFTSVYYGMQIFVGGKGGPEIAVHAKNGTTLDPATVTPLTVNPVAAAPTGDSTYARLDGGNMPFSGNVTAPRLISTVATGTAPLNVTSTTQVPNLNASQLGGLNPPASAIVGISDTQTLTNKSLTSPTSTGADNGTETLSNKTLTSPTSTGTDNGTETLTNKTLTRVQAGTTAPTCSVTGAGAGATCSLASSSNDNSGNMQINTGTGPGTNGTWTLTFNATWPSAGFCSVSLGSGNTTLNARATVFNNSNGVAASQTGNWDNNGAAPTASQATAFLINYVCIGH